MDYHQEFVVDFAQRTLDNLEFIEGGQRDGFSVHEFTQLANSLLGLLVIPKERYIDSIPDTPLSALVADGWPDLRTKRGRLAEQTLRELIKALRISVAHFLVDIEPDESGSIAGVTLWNGSRSSPRWEVEMTVAELRLLVFRFADHISPPEFRKERTV